MSDLLYAIAAWMAFCSLAMITQIGKPRKPLTSAGAVVLLGICAFEIVVLVLAAGRLS